MRRDLAGKRAVVTGASSGIGEALVRELIDAGAKVAAVARRGDRLGGATLAIPADITVPADRERIIAGAIAAFGGLDLLVNNAGVGAWGHFATSTEEINRRVLEVNFFAPVELTRLAVPHLTRGELPALVNVTSMCGRRGMPAWPEYSASKFALVGMGEAWRGEFARYGINVITVVPGLTKSEYSRNLLRNDGKADIPFERGMAPAEVARRIAGAIRANTTELVLGSDAKWMLKLNKFVPRLLDRLIARKVTKLYRAE